MTQRDFRAEIRGANVRSGYVIPATVQNLVIDALDYIDSLRALNAELVEALEAILRSKPCLIRADLYKAASDAVAKAKGETA